jgi:putative addiction module component (TIGR02574 family)
MCARRASILNRPPLKPPLSPYNRGLPREAADLLKEALSLPQEQRAALIDSLLESLDSEIDEDAEEAWRQEIYRRLQQIDSGAVELIPWEDTERLLWAKLRP